MENSTNIIQTKHDLNLRIDEAVYSITKHLSTIFDSIKFNENQELEETNNLQLMSSTEMVSNKLNNLFNIVNEMKADFLKKSEVQFDQEQIQKKNNSENNYLINEKIKKLQDINNNISISLKEFKSKKIYNYSLNIN